MHNSNVQLDVRDSLSTQKPLTHLLKMSFKDFYIMFVLITVVYGVSADCPNMISLASGFNVSGKQPVIWNQIQSDCCTANGVKCDRNERVYQIDWYSKGLEGAINGTAIPSSVTYLDLAINSIIGNIPVTLPSGLINLYLFGNQMSGDLPSFPSAIRFLFLGYPGYPGNRFTGTLRLNRPTGLGINDNWITDVLILDSSVLGTGGFDCFLDNNPLLGNPNIDGLSYCYKNGLYSAGLLLNTRTTSTKTNTSKVGATQSETIRMKEMTLKMFMISDGTKMTEGTEMMTTDIATIDINATTEGEGTTTRIVNGATTHAVGTVQLVPEMGVLTLNFRTSVRVVISGMIMAYVTRKTPFGKAMKRMMKKGKSRRTGVLGF